MIRIDDKENPCSAQHDDDDDDNNNMVFGKYSCSLLTIICMELQGHKRF